MPSNFPSAASKTIIASSKKTDISFRFLEKQPHCAKMRYFFLHQIGNNTSMRRKHTQGRHESAQ